MLAHSAIRACALLAFLATAALAQNKPRARDLGVPFDGTPGSLDAITDVAGVEVGHATLIQGQDVRTGVTAIFPRGKNPLANEVFANWFAQNGNGEMTGTTWVEESGFLGGPVMITNTHSVGVVRDAYIQWQVARLQALNQRVSWLLPVVAETWDGRLNDINGFHVHPPDVVRALESAAGGKVAEGGVGGGTGMICYGFKGGIGTASRKAGPYTVGVLVQCNCGRRNELTIAGVPVGREIPQTRQLAQIPGFDRDQEAGSIIIVVATDAPLVSSQLKRLAHRATMGLARTGATSGNGSGDIFIAFSTANDGASKSDAVQTVQMLPNARMDPLFDATVQATEEAIVNAMVGAETMTGYQGHTVVALPHDKLQEVLKKYNRLEK
ncbi:MAG: P1 family peptidase [Bryobacteraceae bacterium]